jgi:uracil-DNA glycosylase
VLQRLPLKLGNYLDNMAYLRYSVNMMFNNMPRANREPQEINRRLQALSEPHMLPLTAYVAALRVKYPRLEFPDFDPLGGGINARYLFLLEKPGPKTSRAGGGSGFISVCNDDPTAEATWRFMQEAGIEVTDSVHWNVIPGWDGARKYRSSDIYAGIDELPALLALLPLLEVVFLLGGPAAKAYPTLRKWGRHAVVSDHPSPLVRARYPERWAAIPRVWAARDEASR